MKLSHVLIVGALFLTACPEPDPAAPSPQEDAAADASVDVDAGGASDAGGDADASADVVGPTGSGIFAQGCPVPGRSVARRIEGDVQMDGPHVMAGKDDWLIMNEVAAFAVTDPGFRKTYWYYDGVLVDAVRVKDCQQVGLERFEELVPIVAKVDIGDFLSSVIRGFRADRIEVLADGSDGGDAVLRAYGTDDLFWLIDQVFAENQFKDGNGKGLSEPMNLEMWVDFILPPGSPVLTMQLGVRNTGSEPVELGFGLGVWVGDTTERFYFTEADLSVGGYNLDIGTPWFVAESYAGDGSLALGLESSATATVEISGVQALLDSQQAFAMPELGPVGEPDDTMLFNTYIALGETDANSATRELAKAVPELVASDQHTLHPVSGTVVDDTGAPVPDVQVRVERPRSGGFSQLDRFRTDSEGRFSGEVALFGPSAEYRLRGIKEGLHDSEPVLVSIPASGPIAITMGRSGTLQLDVRGEDGTGLPVRVMLYDSASGEQRRRILSATGAEPFAVAPGTYDVSVLRGIEYSPVEQTITITAGETTTLSATMVRPVDTSGFLLMDSHIHGGPSPDSEIIVPERILTAAAEGCEVPVNTDHEFILDYKPFVTELGLDPWVRQVTGEEVTPTLPEHINMFPVVPTVDQDARGGIIKWYGKDIAEIFAMIEERGGAIRQLNHPRNGCNYLCTIGYDRLTGAPTAVPDPTLLGFAADAEMWSWNFNAIELMNGFGNIYLDPTKPDRTGLFEDWMSFHNMGHRVAGMGVTDTHGIRGPCHPGTFFASSTDEPQQMQETELVASVLGGKLVVTTGGFARVSVNGTAGLGDTITDTDGELELALKIEAIPEIDIAFYKVLVNCDEVVTAATTAPNDTVKFDGTVTVPVAADAHIVVLGFGTQAMPRGFPNVNASTTARFITNPVFVDTDGNGTFDPPGGKTCAYTLTGP